VRLPESRHSLWLSGCHSIFVRGTVEPLPTLYLRFQLGSPGAPATHLTRTWLTERDSGSNGKK